jgi:hypothetical protein
MGFSLRQLMRRFITKKPACPSTLPTFHHLDINNSVTPSDAEGTASDGISWAHIVGITVSEVWDRAQIRSSSERLVDVPEDEGVYIFTKEKTNAQKLEEAAAFICRKR